jgi:hypothetical protein
VVAEEHAPDTRDAHLPHGVSGCGQVVAVHSAGESLDDTVGAGGQAHRQPGSRSDSLLGRRAACEELQLRVARDLPPACELRPVRHWRERQSLREQDHNESDHRSAEMSVECLGWYGYHPYTPVGK